MKVPAKPIPAVKPRLSVTIRSEGGIPLSEEEIKRIWSRGGKYEVDLKII